MKRPLPDETEAMHILAAKRTRPQRRPPTPVGRRLNKLVKDLDDRFGQGAGPLKARWGEIVGETLARRTEPVKLVRMKTGGDVLEIRVDGAAATLIQHQAGEILERVNMVLGSGAASKLRIVQGPVRATAPPAAKSSRRKPPLDAAAEAALAASLEPAPDGALKDALMRLGREVLRKGR